MYNQKMKISENEIQKSLIEACDIKGIIFDFNGTMFFDDEFQNEAWRRFFLEKYHRVVSEEEFDLYTHGVNSVDTFKYFLGKSLTFDEAKELEEEKEVIYRNLCLKSEKFKLADGLEEFLNFAKQKGIKQNIATASAFKNTKFFFDNLDLYRWFDLNRTAYNNGKIKSKPDPEIFIIAANNLGLNLSDCIVFEDSRNGIIAAKNGGAKLIVGVASRLSEDELKSYGANLVINEYIKLEHKLFDNW